MSVKYTRGKQGTPVPIIGGSRKAAKARFKRPAAGLVMLEPVPRKKGAVGSGYIYAPTDDAEMDVSTWKILAKGSNSYILKGTGAAMPFAFEEGEHVILKPDVQFSNGAVDGTVRITEDNPERDDDGRPMRVIVQMSDVIASVYPAEEKAN